jgi:hypothetical protein
MSVAALEARWAAFLAKIEARFAEIMAESAAGCAALLAHAGGDVVPLSNAWSAMRGRAIELQAKVTDTWTDTVEAQFHAIAAYEAAERARARGDALRDAMEIELERVEITIFADALRSLLQLAKAEQVQLSCSQCAGELPLPAEPLLAAIDLPCRFCGGLNTVEPGPRARSAAALGHYLWNEACWELWLARHRADEAVRRARTPTLEQLRTWEAAEIAYWSAWLRARARQLPATAADFDKELRGRTHQLYMQLEREPAWFKAGAKRAIS